MYMSKERLKEKAVENHEYRKLHFAKEIEFSTLNSEVFGGDKKYNYDVGEKRYDSTKYDIYGVDIRQYLLSYLKELDGKTAVLNFASYNNPGGKYMNGMMAQEEALCHCTTLYEVLINNVDFYSWNNVNKNRGLYKDRMLYTPKILLLDDLSNPVGSIDVITCAAPNMSVGLRYGNFTESECNRVFYNRVLFLMHMAAYKQVDNLILGAWGCGVFKNNINIVTKSFMTIQEMYRGYFKNVFYVIPKDVNYYAFLKSMAEQ